MGSFGSRARPLQRALLDFSGSSEFAPESAAALAAFADFLFLGARRYSRLDAVGL